MASTPPTRRAVIDVGTNSVKLLVADVTPDAITPQFETSEQTRLGRGFYQSHILQRDAIALTATVVSKFTEEAIRSGAGDVKPFATSAARDAHNADELCSAIREACGQELTIISGETEAEWAFEGASSCPALGNRMFLLMDVGGGSTEFVLGQNGQRHFSRSFALGTVRTIEALPHSDPPKLDELVGCRRWISEFIRSEVVPSLAPALETRRSTEPVLLAATGGTGSILAAMELELAIFDRERIEATLMSTDLVNRWVEKLWGMPLATRRQLPGLPPPRADVILAGTVIVETVMRQFGFGELRVSTRGLRFAALRELWR